MVDEPLGTEKNLMLTAVLCPASMTELERTVHAQEGLVSSSLPGGLAGPLPSSVLPHTLPNTLTGSLPDTLPETAGEPSAGVLRYSLKDGLYTCMEVRLDFCNDLQPGLLPSFPLPAILTLRGKTQGGQYQHSEQLRLQTIAKLLETAPAYMDLEDDIAPEVLRELQTISPNTTIILSHHNFEHTPDLPALLESMQRKLPSRRGVLYKIACQAHSTLDALTMLAFSRQAHSHLRQYGSGFIGISMGQQGISTRILAPVIHYGFCYCPLSSQTAPGQMDANTLVRTYNADLLNHSTAIYGLLGDPVEQSKGHTFHNALNRQNKINAVYVKWQVSRQDLQEALWLLHDLGVEGLSITMPLKKAARLHCAMPAGNPYEAVNTLRRTADSPSRRQTPSDQDATAKKETAGTTPDYSCQPIRPGQPEYFQTDCAPKQRRCHWEGANTDGPGALQSIPLDVQKKTVIIAGAGGSATALITALHQAGACCLVYNRSHRQLPCGLATHDLAELFTAPLPGHDIIINTLPFDTDLPFETISFKAHTVAFDISYAKESRFLAAARTAGCKTVTGDDMFTNQALLQRRFWGLE